MSERNREKIEHGSFILANLLAASLEEWQWLPQWFMCMCLASTKLEQAYIMKMGWQQCNNATFPALLCSSIKPLSSMIEV